MLTLFHSWHFDDAYIFYRYAANIRLGNGYCFNPGERFLGTTSPLWTLTLAALAPTVPLIPLTAKLLGYVFLALSAFLLGAVMIRHNMAAAAFVMAFLVITSQKLAICSGMETFQYLCCIAVIVYLLENRQSCSASVVAGLAILSRPEAILIAPIVILWGFPRSLKPYVLRAVLLGLPLSAWMLFSYVYFGALLPGTLAAKQAQVASTYWLSFGKHLTPWLIGYASHHLLLFCIMLCGLGILIRTLLSGNALGLLACWILLYTAGYMYLKVPNYHWYYAPLDFMVIVSICVLAGWVEQRSKKYMALSIVGAIILLLQLILYPLNQQAIPRDLLIWLPPIISVVGLFIAALLKKTPHLQKALCVGAITLPFLVLHIQSVHHFAKQPVDYRDRAYEETAIWIKEHTPFNASLLCFEVGALGYYSERFIIDPLGLVTPNLCPHIAQQQYQAAFELYKPDYLLLHEPRWEKLEEAVQNSILFQNSYHLLHSFQYTGYGGLQLWQRQADGTALLP